MGVVYKPEDLRKKKKKRIPDIEPRTLPEPIAPSIPEDLAEEVRKIRLELERVKRALKDKGIRV